ncbi:MAG: winged helix-turn-helix transcriptional regulator [Kiritimatiellae bacterium]|nr:winged helix-turn-helix transcriptional regulator [Kiritimatiellia bacterium]
MIQNHANIRHVQESLRFIERNTRTAYRINGLRREDVPEYPMAALREARTNAVMHRDWFNGAANVFVEIYSDRTEISNPGGLPRGMRPSDLGRKSVRRNPLIADLLHRIAFIEKAGTGINRMRNDARSHGYPEPTFEDGTFFTESFFPTPAAEADRGTRELERGSEKGSEKSSEEILSCFRANPHASAREVAEVLGVSARAVEKQIALLKSRGRLKRVGPARGGRWQVSE